MHPIYTGAAEHHLKDGSVRHFKPTGPMYLVHGKAPARRRGAREAEKDIIPLTPGLTARLFVGLSVGQTPTYTVDQVVEATIENREKAGLRPDATFIAQKGLYTDEDAPPNESLVRENSVQIIIINYPVQTPEAFDAAIRSLARQLRAQFKQNSVIVEIQEGGVSKSLYMVVKE